MILDREVEFPRLADTPYFGPGPAAFMVNYRVRDLDAMLAQLRAAGAQVEDRVEEYEYGRFGWASDPEGNQAIEVIRKVFHLQR